VCYAVSSHHKEDWPVFDLLLLLLLLFLVVALIAAIFIILGLVSYRRSLLRSVALPAPPRLPVDCLLPGGPLPTDTDPEITLTGNETDSDIRGNTIELPPGVTFFPPPNLMLVAFGDLTINGRIPIALGSGDTLTLVSVSGAVRIGATAVIGPAPVTFSVALPATGTGTYALALGAPGTTGGFVKIVAPVVIIEGTIQAEPGGGGALATATGMGLGPIGGTAVAVGGRGGFGGTIIICAEETIDIIDLALIRAGAGGNGGTAVATASNASEALAAGGPGNDGGNVVFSGTGEGPCQVTFRGVGGFAPTVKGGNGGNGGTCTATGGAGRTSAFVPISLLVGGGGRGTAGGGFGGAGGTVRFVNCEVSPGASVMAGSGGVGGAGAATGGVGAPAVVLTGYSGGDTDALGGDGGLIGELRPYSLIGGGSGAVAAPTVAGGGGGTATATGGTGGTGGRAPFLANGGSSGEADAVGGSNPNTLATAIPATSAPVAGAAGIGGAGGVGPPATSPGAP
jgi:hypothetical protein